ncbi:hypothetical protein K353_03026 [Kitasatospora sp. SolWspMP-SS2h]|uniref:hypothetical protein n=1 Tax=Kitasatospora sp. SolWspMP-SS2h TaxID=1305729 RepID=UPI000DC04F40|nr:hypothetical protein [Kitasatospora sp. SolWspMP-SS2h]RAJ41267.1 hypothetical protein K353_03026 [Kitasatospora sp. SolWspMP-SS2h]
MSFPLTRRIAQAALLVAATAAPLAAAGAASATEVVPQTDLGAGVTKLADVPNSGDAVQGATHELGHVVGTTGAATLAAGGPAAADAAGNTVAHNLPSTDDALGKLGPLGKADRLTGSLDTLTDKVAPAVEEKVAPAVTDKVVPATQKVTGTPLSTVARGLPTDKLAQGLPAADKLGPVTGAVQSLPVAGTLAGLTEHESANRLGGVPSLGGDSPLGGLTGALGPVGGLLGGIQGGGLPIG